MDRNGLDELLGKIRLPDEAFKVEIQARLDDLTKPPGSLGRLEEVALALASMQGKVKPQVGRKCIYTLAGDHGVTEEGVSAFPSEVTPQMVLNFLNGGAAINVLTRHAGAEIRVVDMGVDFDFEQAPGLVHAKVARGTANFTKGPAMGEGEVYAALETGIELARSAADEGVELLGIGEMGIGNTTPAAAILSLLGGLAPGQVVGRGTGVDDAGLKRKADAIARGIEVNKPDPSDPMDVLMKMGGFEIAGMTGICIGAAERSLPLVVDGFISSAAALLAVKLQPAIGGYLFLSHLSQEQGHAKMVELIGLKPLMDLELRLGEGTGSALAMGIIEASAKILSEMATFSEAGVSNKD